MAWGRQSRGSNSWFKQSTKEEQQQSAEKMKRALEKKKIELSPVSVPGRTIVKSWWGKAWTDNLERYADYESRLPRGRSYVRAGTVIDLKMGAGRVDAMVAGSKATPYRITVTFDPLAAPMKKRISEACSGRIGSLSDLLSGKIPDEMKVLFTQKGGLFPTPKEIHFHCSCPDWASMCKHVAAVMYGIGVRIDEQPELFFQLRGVEMAALVTQAIVEQTEALAEGAVRSSRRVMASDDLSALFGIEMDAVLVAETAPVKRGPGRSKKSETLSVPVSEAVVSSLPAKRGPGRPRKDAFPPTVVAEPDLEKRKPGRPKKTAVQSKAVSETALGKRKPGRPKKDRTAK